MNPNIISKQFDSERSLFQIQNDNSPVISIKKQASQVLKTFGLLQLFTNVCWNEPFVMSQRVMTALSRKWRCTTNWKIKTVKPVSKRLSAKPNGKHQDEHILNGRLLHILATYCLLRRGSFKGTHLGKHRRNTVNVSPGG